MPKDKKTVYQSPRGMHDVLPQDEGYWRKITQEVFEIADFYNFGLLLTPIVESREIFEEGTGEATEIVEKQMYVLKSSDGLVLRPEKTAALARAYIEHGFFNKPQPQKFYSVGPMFRHEKPQEGRFRQFYQIDFDIVGEEHAVSDSQIIQLFFKLFHNLGLKDVIVEVNSIGCKECRPAIKESLRTYYRRKLDQLCPDCKSRYQKNIFRLLDCKNENCKTFRSQAPHPLDKICQQCSAHFKLVLEYLDTLNLPYELNPYLVRGLDYYSRTVFEFFKEGDRSMSLAGGGRYDYLIQVLGGKDTPAVGGAAGVERIVEEMKKRKTLSPKKQAEVFLAQIGADARKEALKLMNEFYKENFLVHENLGRDSLDTQLKIADNKNVTYALILGQEEILKGEVILRDMKSGLQESIPREKIIEEIKKRLKK